MSTILPVAQRGEIILTLTAATVAKSELNSDWLNQLAEAMHTTMMQRNGVGIAAPSSLCLETGHYCRFTP